jgi:hypothetical protein
MRRVTREEERRNQKQSVDELGAADADIISCASSMFADFPWRIFVFMEVMTYLRFLRD